MICTLHYTLLKWLETYTVRKRTGKYHFTGEGIYGRIALKQNACESGDSIQMVQFWPLWKW
jgi:hypothetical protein